VQQDRFQDRNRPYGERNDRGGRERFRRDDDLGPAVMGFGDEIPAFMLITARKKPVVAETVVAEAPAVVAATIITGTQEVVETPVAVETSVAVETPAAVEPAVIAAPAETITSPLDPTPTPAQTVLPMAEMSGQFTAEG
jgi:hypothetical protein